MTIRESSQPGESGSVVSAGSVASTGITDSTAAGRAMLTAADVAAQRTALGLGTSALQSSAAFATAAQGALATSALQPGALPVGTTIPAAQVTGLGSAATQASTAFAPAPADTIAVAASRALTTADAGKTLDVTASGVTLTIPNGLTLKPGVAIIKHSSGTSVAVSGGATINGGTTTLAITASVAALLPRSTTDAYTLTGV